MDITNILVSLGLPIATLLVGIWIARQKAPFENRASQSLSDKSEAEGDRVRAETITIQNSTIAGLVQQVSTMTGTIFGMQNAQNVLTNEINNCNVKIAKQELEIKRLSTGNESLLAEVTSGRTREEDQRKLIIQQRALIDSLPQRLDFLEAALLKEGVVPPRDKAVDTARAAIERQEGKVAAATSTTQAQDAAKIAIEAVSVAIDEAKLAPTEPDAPPSA